MEEVERPSILEILLRTAAAALPAAGIALLEPDGSSLRVAARLGFGPELDEKLITQISRVLGETADAGAVPACSTVAFEALPRPFAFGAAALIGDGQEQELGLLVALGCGPKAFNRHQRCTLARFADLMSAQLSHDRERRLAEARIGEVNRALGDALEALPEAIAVFDRDDRFVFWNEEFEQTYAGPGVILKRGTRFEDHLRACVAAGLVVAAHGREESWLAERLARFHAADNVHEHEIGDGRWVRVQDRLLPNGGRAGIRTDVTELVQREHSFRHLFEANPVPMLVLDRQTLQIRAANGAAVAMYGFKRRDLVHLTFFDIQPGSSPEEVDSILTQFGGAFAGSPQTHRTADGEERTVRISTQPIDWEGRPALLAAMFDVTERHRMEDEIRRTRAFLRHVVDQVPAAMFVKDMWDGGRYVICNRAGASLVGRLQESVLGRRTEEIFNPEDAALIVEQDEKALRSGGQRDLGGPDSSSSRRERPFNTYTEDRPRRSRPGRAAICARAIGGHH